MMISVLVLLPPLLNRTVAPLVVSLAGLPRSAVIVEQGVCQQGEKGARTK
jgi:hypothetical protein